MVFRGRLRDFGLTPAQALKLAERTIQFADTLTVLTDGYTRAGRLAHAEGQIAEAVRHFSAAADGQKTALGAIGLAQVQIKNGEEDFCTLGHSVDELLADEFAGAIHTLDKFLETPGGSKSLEATTILACLRACPRPGVSSSETTRDKTRARELFDAVSKALGDRQNGIGGRTTRSQRRVMDDPDMYCEIATLWVEDDLGRARRALTEAARAGGAAADPRVTNNLGAIAALEGDHKEARVLFQSALTAAITGDGSSGLLADQAEAVNTTVLYNLARTYEELGEDNLAKEAYDKLLTRHPEYVDGA
jgi:RNA polymerase-associated protein CTR9